MRHNGHETSERAWVGGAAGYSACGAARGDLAHGISTGRDMAGRVRARQKDRDERRRVNYCGAVCLHQMRTGETLDLEVAVTRTGQAGAASVARHIQT